MHTIDLELVRVNLKQTDYERIGKTSSKKFGLKTGLNQSRLINCGVIAER